MKNKKWFLAAILLLLLIPSAVALAAYSRTFTLTGSVTLNLPTPVPTSAPTPTTEPTPMPTFTPEATPTSETTPTPEVSAPPETTATPALTTTPTTAPTPEPTATAVPTQTPRPTPTPTPVQTVKITYYSVLGSHTYSEYVPQNSTITLQGEIFSYPGWVQVGWATYAGASYPQYDLGDSYNTKKKAIKLYAVWDLDWSW